MFPPSAWDRPIADWLNWLRSDGRPLESVAVRRTQITKLARAHRGVDPWSLTTQDLANWLAKHPEWSVSYRRAIRSAVRGFYGWARATGRCDYDPAQLIPRSRPEITKPRPAPDQVVERALDRSHDERTQLMIELGRDCGLRRAEIAGVHTNDIELIRGVWMLRVHGKGNRERLVPLDHDLARRLLARDAGWVFPSPARFRAGLPLTPAHVGKIVTRALGGGIWTTHTLRHGYATAAYAVDRDLMAVRDLLGHSSVSTTQMYVIAPDDAVMRAAHGARLRRRTAA